MVAISGLLAIADASILPHPKKCESGRFAFGRIKSIVKWFKRLELISPPRNSEIRLNEERALVARRAEFGAEFGDGLGVT
ncbi:MAG: hypothetical protein ACI87E_001690 [Mariniblastus sp.]